MSNLHSSSEFSVSGKDALIEGLTLLKDAALLMIVSSLAVGLSALTVLFGWWAMVPPFALDAAYAACRLWMGRDYGCRCSSWSDYRSLCVVW